MALSPRAGLLALALSLGVLPASAAESRDPIAVAQLPDTVEETLPPREITAKPPAPSQPLLMRMMLHPIERGMFIGLPVMDTDPNRGVTVGVMPIWVIREKGADRVEQIHAPSATWNRNFGPKPTYRYYWYPNDDSSLVLRGSFARYEREIMGQFEDRSFLGTEWDVNTRVQHEIDASRRFFGIGPNTPESDETNYKANFVQVRVVGGHPLLTRSYWRLRFSDNLETHRVSNGPIDGLRGFEEAFPGLAPKGHQQSNEMRLTLDYDSRDHATATTRGALAQVYSEHSVRGFASSYDYNRYGLDARYFKPWAGRRRAVTAAQVRYEQLLGTAPFWLQPRLGGKYSLRAYGDGRYIDRGMVATTVEHRITLHQIKAAGVTTELEVAPFVGVGTVFSSPKRAAGKFARPVFGGAVRAVARPQVVGSLDFGVGQEGVAIFMDINYSF